MTWVPLAFHRFRDALRRAETGRAAGRFREAIEAYTEAMVVRGGDLTCDQEADLRNRIALCYLDLGEVDAAELAIDPIAALDRARILPSTRGATSFVRGRIALTRGDYAATVRHASEAWETLRSTGENSLVARALNVRGHGHRQLGDVEQAREDYTDALAAARRAGDDHETGLASSNLGFLLWLSGRYDEARAFHRRAVEIHEGCGSDAQLSRELFALAVDELHAGDWQQCEALLLRTAERARQAEDRRLLSATGILKARLQHARGEDPRQALEEATRIAEANDYGHDRIVIGQLLGDAALERGDWPEARRVLTAAWDRARKAGPESEPAAETAWRLALALEAAGDPDGNVPELLAFARKTAAGHGYRACEASARRATAEVLANRGRIDEARDHARSAVDLFRGLAMPYELGRSRTVLARLCAQSVTDASLAAPMFREAAGALAALGAKRDAAHAEEGLAEVSGEAVAAAKGAAGAGEPFTEIVTACPDMAEAVRRSRRIAPSDIPVLITGETGTGKELFARSIHRASKRRERPFLAVNCAALTETLLEAELFGHVKGAFTGAMSAKTGIFEAANGGTVFLDEIGKAPAALQAKLLRVLDTGEVRRVGGVEAMHVNVRIVAATNRDLPGLVDRNEFLPDLLYRLRGYEIHVPALRDRAGDVALLFEHFAGRPATESAQDVLEAHDWPGNVREIRNLAESASFLTLGRGPISVDALPEWIRKVAAGEEEPRELSAHVTGSERQALLKALMRCGGNRSAAARRLGISRQTLYTKMEKHGIDGRVEAA